MRTRPLGKTGLDVTELALGTWGLSGDGYGPVSEVEAERTIDRALDLGINLFDTSDAYGKGAMEALLGKRLAERGEPTYVVTKLGIDRSTQPPVKRFEPEYLKVAVERSRERLARPRIDVVLLHNPTLLTVNRGEAVAAMKELEQAGTIGGWGVSAGDLEIARASLTQGAKVVELVYNLFFSRELHDLAGDLLVSGAGVLARSVLAYGMLTGHFNASRVFGEGDHRKDRWTESEKLGRLKQLDGLRPLVTGDVLTMRAAALRFVLANNLVSSAVLGPRSVTQLDQLVREAGKQPPYLPDAALARLPSDLAKVGIRA